MTDLCVPWLRSGVGETPAKGGCIMQVIDWIDTGGWTDSPRCVHLVLQKLGIYANDYLDDLGRQRLLDLAPRLMGTASDDKQLAVRLATFCARRVLDIYEKKYPGDERPRAAIKAAEQWVDDPSSKNAAAAYAAYAAYAAGIAAATNATYAAHAGIAAAAHAAYAAYAAANAANAAAAANAATTIAAAANAAANAATAKANDTWQLLVDTLDEYDRLTGRMAPPAVDLAPVARMLQEASR